MKVSTREEANDLVFIQADVHPSQSGVYQYREVSEGRSEFTPGRKSGRVRLKSLGKKFIKVGKKIKRWLEGTLVCYNINTTWSVPSAAGLCLYIPYSI